MGCQIGMIFNGKITLKFIENSWKLKKVDKGKERH